MPITDYHFENRIFFAKEWGIVSKDDAEMWSAKLKEFADTCSQPIVALVDAMDVTAVQKPAQKIFIDSGYFDNILAIIVATNTTVALQAETIGLLGKRSKTRIWPSLEKAYVDAEAIIRLYQN